MSSLFSYAHCIHALYKIRSSFFLKDVVKLLENRAQKRTTGGGPHTSCGGGGDAQRSMRDLNFPYRDVPLSSICSRRRVPRTEIDSLRPSRTSKFFLGNTYTGKKNSVCAGGLALKGGLARKRRRRLVLPKAQTWVPLCVPPCVTLHIYGHKLKRGCIVRGLCTKASPEL